MAKVESDFQARVLSPKGARGVMQIMPATAEGEFGGSIEQRRRRLRLLLADFAAFRQPSES